MRSAIHSLLIVSLAAGAAACVDETASPVDLQATEQPLHSSGVYYLQATGTAESPAFTFYDQNKVAIGAGQVSQDGQRAEIEWRGSSWERTAGAFVGANSADPGDLDTALTVFERSVDQAFPAASGAIGMVDSNSCSNVVCQRPNLRCTGGCTGYDCSATDGSRGHCEPPGAWPRPTPH